MLSICIMNLEVYWKVNYKPCGLFLNTCTFFNDIMKKIIFSLQLLNVKMKHNWKCIYCTSFPLPALDWICSSSKELSACSREGVLLLDLAAQIYYMIKFHTFTHVLHLLTFSCKLNIRKQDHTAAFFHLSILFMKWSYINPNSHMLLFILIRY